MSAPTRYILSYDFTAFQSANPTTPLPADKVEIEFNNLQTTTDEIIDNLGIIQRSDGALTNGVVSFDSLSTTVQALLGTSISPKGSWVTSTAYSALDLVSKDGSSYICAVAHTSGTFSTDLTAGKWVIWAADAASSLPALGTAHAVLKQNSGGTDLEYDLIRAENIGASAVTDTKIAGSAITAGKIAGSAITEGKIAGSAVTTGKIADLNVTTIKLADASVTTAKIADNNVTLAKMATQAANTILAEVTGSTAVPAAVTVAANKFLARSSTGNIAAKDITDFGLLLVAATDAAAVRSLIGGTIVDRAYTETNAETISNSVIPHDNTVPQVTEGVEVLSAVITPKSNTNRIRASVNMFVQTDAGTVNGAAAMFVNGGSNAVQAVTGATGNTTRPWVLSMQYEYVPGSTSQQTISVRIGPSSAGSMYLNQSSAGVSIFGDAAKATLILEEIAV